MVHNPEITIRKVGDNTYLYKSGMPVARINETASIIIEQYLKGNSKSDIAHGLVELFSLDIVEAKQDVDNLIATLDDLLC